MSKFMKQQHSDPVTPEVVAMQMLSFSMN